MQQSIFYSSIYPKKAIINYKNLFFHLVIARINLTINILMRKFFPAVVYLINHACDVVYSH